MIERNGSVRLAYWVMGALFSIIMLLVGGATAAFSGRLAKVEEQEQHDAAGLSSMESNLESKFRALQLQVCQLEDRVNDLREDVTHKRVYRRACP
jgi:uncharacterized protein YlxW (UPF0749 family)